MPYRNLEKRKETRRKYWLLNKEILNNKARERYSANIIRESNKRKKYYDRLKDDIFKHYGAQCKCCSEKHREFLTIDHINGGGAKHRKLLGGAFKFYVWLREKKYPEDFRVLCYNCNSSLGQYGYCPHEMS